MKNKMLFFTGTTDLYYHIDKYEIKHFTSVQKLMNGYCVESNTYATPNDIILLGLNLEGIHLSYFDDDMERKICTYSITYEL